MIRTRPRADHVNRYLGTRFVVTSSQRLSIGRDHLSVRDIMQCGDPTQQALLELLRVNVRQNMIKAIMRRDATGEVQKPAEPPLILPSKGGNHHEVIRPTNDRTQRHDNNVDQRIGRLLLSQISQPRKVLLNRNASPSVWNWFPMKR